MTIPLALKVWMRRHIPSVYSQVAQILGKDRPVVTRALVELSQSRIHGGPFRGMAYLDEATGSALLPKLVGSYESELHSWIESAVRTGYDTVIDVGCAEGYYAVGMALRLPDAKVIAFDTDSDARQLCRKLAQLNGVSARVEVDGHCDTNRLNDAIRGKTLIICDCEGYELQLLNPLMAPKLESADVIVELHPMVDPTIPQQITERFARTHEVALVYSGDRNPADYPLLAGFSLAHAQIALSEHRTARMPWALLTSGKAES